MNFKLLTPLTFWDQVDEYDEDLYYSKGVQLQTEVIYVKDEDHFFRMQILGFGFIIILEE